METCHKRSLCHLSTSCHVKTTGGSRDRDSHRVLSSTDLHFESIANQSVLLRNDGEETLLVKHTQEPKRGRARSRGMDMTDENDSAVTEANAGEGTVKSISLC